MYIDGSESDWSNVEVVTLPHGYKLGDCNHDGRVDINDVTWLIDALLDPSIETCPICSDVDRDGRVVITDLTVLIDMILTSQPINR